MTTELAAGPELDARVAVQIFGAVRMPLGTVMWDGVMPRVTWAYRVGETTVYYTSLPAYSTDIAAAWLVVAELTRIERTARLENTRFAYWWDGAHLWAYSAPEAATEICHAALAAVAASRPGPV